MTISVALVALAFSFTTQIASWLWDRDPGPYIFLLASTLAGGILPGLLWGIRGVRQGLGSDIHSVEGLKWSWSRAKKIGFWSSMVGAALGIVWIFYSWSSVARGFTIENAIFFLLIVAFQLGLLGAAFGGWNRSVLKTKTRPNQGILLSIRSALFGALLVGGVIGTVWAVYIIVSRPTLWDMSGVYEVTIVESIFKAFPVGVDFGIIGSLAFGMLDVIQHYTLRFILHFTKQLPFRLTAFLNHAVSLIFLRRVGGSYIFIHRMLLEHFAENIPAALPKPDGRR